MQRNISSPALCPCWGTPARVFRPAAGQKALVDSSRSGGEYMITTDAEVTIKNYDNLWKPLLTSWLVEQRRAGISVPTITEDVLNIASERKPLDISERADRILEYLSTKTAILGKPVSYRISGLCTSMLI